MISLLPILRYYLWKNGSNEITIPFNREQLASYLVSERSSVCRELSKLKNDNIISIKGTILCEYPRKYFLDSSILIYTIKNYFNI